MKPQLQHHHDALMKLRLSLIMLLGLLIVGMTGFAIIGDRTPFDALYLAVIVLTTVGLKDGGAPLSHAEEAWAVVLMLAGIGTALYATGNIVAFVVEGQFGNIFGRRQVMSRINNLRDHFVVAGFGRMGEALCATLAYRELPFVLIETDPERLAQADALGYLSVRGDAMHEETLMQAHIDRARGLATCLAHDADNVFVTLTARGLNPKALIIARSEDARTEFKLRRAGADRVICPAVIGAGQVTHHLLNPLVDEMIELDGHWPDLEISKLSVRRFPQTAGRSLADVIGDNHGEVAVVALVNADGTRTFRPAMDTLLAQGDEIVIIGPAGCIGNIVQCMSRLRAA